MNTRTCLLAPLLTGVLILNCLAQSPAAPDPAQAEAARAAAKAEQEKALALASANAEKLDKAVDALIAETQTALAANAPLKTYDTLLSKLSSLSLGNQTPRDRYNQNAKLEILRTFITRWQDFLYASAQGNFEVAGQTLRQMIQDAAALPIIPRSELMAIQEQLAMKSAEADQALLTPLLKKMDELFDSANASADFDGLLLDIATAQAKLSRNRQNGNIPALRTMQGLRQFVSRWQEYLTLRNSGKLTEAQNAMRNLVSEGEYAADETILQYRTKARNKANQPKPAGPVPEPLKVETLTLENLDNFASALKAQEPALSGSPGSTKLADALQRLVAARNQIRSHEELAAMKSLHTGGLEFVVSNTGSFAPALETIRRALMNQGIAHFLKSSLAPLPDEKPRDFLTRLTNDQIEAKNYQAAYDALKLAELLNGQGPQNEGPDVAVFRALVEGLNQEAAQQYTLAVKSFQRAVGTPSRLVPIKDLTALLNKIKAEHPEEYRKAQEADPRPLPPVSTSLPTRKKPFGPKTTLAANNDNVEPPDDWKRYYFGSGPVSRYDDHDQDGVTDYQEYAQGTDPTDYYNGENPVMTELEGTDRATGEYAMKVSRPDGTPYVEAPVTFEVNPAVAQLAGNPDSTITHQILKRRTDKDGIARVYIRPAAVTP